MDKRVECAGPPGFEPGPSVLETDVLTINTTGLLQFLLLFMKGAFFALFAVLFQFDLFFSIGLIFFCNVILPLTIAANPPK